MEMPTPRERWTYMVVCALWREWRAPALLVDIARCDRGETESVKERLQRLRDKGWIVVAGVRRSMGRGWVPTHQARAMDRLDEIMSLVFSVANATHDEDQFTNKRTAMHLLAVTGWEEANPTDPKE